MVNFFWGLCKRPPDPVLEEIRQQLRGTMAEMHHLTIQQLKKDLAPYDAEIDWENPSGRKPEPSAEPAAESADPDQPEPGETSPAARAQLPVTADDDSRGSRG